jgi:hypothetical protein
MWITIAVLEVMCGHLNPSPTRRSGWLLPSGCEEKTFGNLHGLQFGFNQANIQLEP